MNDSIVKMYTKIISNISSGRFDVHLQVRQPSFEISTSNLTHKVPPNTSFAIRKSLKRMPSLAYTERGHTKCRVSSMFAFGCIILTLIHEFTCR